MCNAKLFVHGYLITITILPYGRQPFKLLMKK